MLRAFPVYTRTKIVNALGKRPMNSIWETPWSNGKLRMYRELKLLIEEHEANLRQSRAEEEKQRIFRVWWIFSERRLIGNEKREKALKYITSKLTAIGHFH
jgi:hypothetical protein